MSVFLRRIHRAYVALRGWSKWLRTQPFTTSPDSPERYSVRVHKFGMDPVKWAVERYRRKHPLKQNPVPNLPAHAYARWAGGDTELWSRLTSPRSDFQTVEDEGERQPGGADVV